MSVPLLAYMRSHSCSKEREKPTSADKCADGHADAAQGEQRAETPAPEILQANPVKDSWEAMTSGKVLKSFEIFERCMKGSLSGKGEPCPPSAPSLPEFHDELMGKETRCKAA